MASTVGTRQDVRSRSATGRAVDPVLLGQLAFPLALIALWQVVGMLAGDFYVATPVQAVDAVADGVSGGWFFNSLGATLAATAIGFLIAAVAGLWIGVTLGLVRFWGKVFEPITLSVYSIPKVTLFPIFLTVFGFGLYSKIAFGMFHGIFPIVIIAMSATREVSPVHLKVAQSLRLSRTDTFRQVIFPSIYPSLLTGLRLGFSLTLLGVVLGEMFASREGFGYELVEAITLHDMPRMYGIIAVLVVIAFVVNALFLRWEHAAERSARGVRG
jgi:NitT/TauT family transport system permease protein